MEAIKHTVKQEKEKEKIMAHKNFSTMIKRVFLTGLLVVIFPAFAQSNYTVTKIVDNGADSNKLVWVILGDGYRENDLKRLRFDASFVVSTIFAASPWKEYASYINVYLVEVVSYEKGADHPADGVFVDTALDASFGDHGMERLITVNDAKAFDAAAVVPNFDMVMVLVNDRQYGGSAGSTVVITNNWQAGRLALHEIGHFMGGLADEYDSEYASYPAHDHEPNVTFATNAAQIPWSKWIDPSTPLPTPDSEKREVGLFEGAKYHAEGIYRPKCKCTMKKLFAPYCEVCSEAIVLNIYNYVDPIVNYAPSNERVILVPGETVTFRLQVQEPGNHHLAIRWELDGRVLEGESGNTLTLGAVSLTGDIQTLTATVVDETPLVKNDPDNLLTSSHSWTVGK